MNIYIELRVLIHSTKLSATLSTSYAHVCAIRSPFGISLYMRIAHIVKTTFGRLALLGLSVLLVVTDTELHVPRICFSFYHSLSPILLRTSWSLSLSLTHSIMCFFHIIFLCFALIASRQIIHSLDSKNILNVFTFNKIIETDYQLKNRIGLHCICACACASASTHMHWKHGCRVFLSLSLFCSQILCHNVPLLHYVYIHSLYIIFDNLIDSNVNSSSSRQTFKQYLYG